jgi:hypothetical protein
MQSECEELPVVEQRCLIQTEKSCDKLGVVQTVRIKEFDNFWERDTGSCQALFSLNVS